MVAARSPVTFGSHEHSDQEGHMGSETKATGPDLRAGVDANSVGTTLLGHVDDQPVLLVRHGQAIRAVAATCTHYGGPLAEGIVTDGTIHCPWHHACFDLA